MSLIIPLRIGFNKKYTENMNSPKITLVKLSYIPTIAAGWHTYVRISYARYRIALELLKEVNKLFLFLLGLKANFANYTVVWYSYILCI